ncbi:hypothetical protein GCM10010255_82840 [Streptomyces coeruleofuscus]|uniref:Tetratricopeptide repeat protein n=1 Tax=Streptomyces coeruleofuscus TaxID=66879 RepID=A0ABP5WL43_9ACTN
MVRWPGGRRDSGKGPEPPEAAVGNGHQPDPRDTLSAAVPGASGTGPTVINSGNATVTHGGFANTGIYSPTVHLPPEAMRPPAEVDAPAGLNNLPHQPGHFIGRSRDLDRLDTARNTPGTALVQVVHGLGGVGKSTLAAHWAATRPHGCTPVRWITADSPADVQQGLASLTTALQPALAKALPVKELAEWGLQWLASHNGWLLILDNVNDPTDIAHVIARAPGGRFLITSRLATAWSQATNVVRLDVLDEAESLALFSRITTAAGPRDLDGAAALCAVLGYLPLAIDQVAAYLAQNPLTTPRAYLDLFAQHPAAMFSQGGATTPTERTITRIWDITLDQITTRQPAAADLLRTLAWYAPENIPTTLLNLPDMDPATLNQAIGLLTAYNVITPDPATNTLSIHRLVQAVTRTPAPDNPHRTHTHIDYARTHATSNLANALPSTRGDPATWPTWRSLLPHIDALADRTETDTITTASLLSNAGCFLTNQGSPAPGIKRLQRALTALERLLGADHPSTLATRSNLALAYQEAGDLARAIPLSEEILADRLRVQGADHPDTLATRSNLALAYQEAGDPARAIPLHEQILADGLRVQGADHPDTLTSRNNLALAYQEAGDPARAIPLHEQILADRLRVLGDEHPHTLTTRSNLAGAYRDAGDLGRAIPLHEKILADRLRVLGADHPHTLRSRHNLAGTYREAGDLSRAIRLSEQNLTDQLRVLGADHPDTLTTRNNLALAYQEAGDPARAIPLHEQILADRLRVLGGDHPDTLTSRNNLAGVYWEAGDLSRAIPLYEQNLTDLLRVLGPDHPDTLTTMGVLAHWREEAGDHSGAATAWKKLLTARVRVLGPDHPDSVTAWDQLASSRAKAGDPEGAAAATAELAAGLMRLLGPDHPHTLSARGHLAYYQGMAGDADAAAIAITQLLEDCLRALGPDHPDTRAIRECAAYWQAIANEEAP